MNDDKKHKNGSLQVDDVDDNDDDEEGSCSLNRRHDPGPKHKRLRREDSELDLVNPFILANVDSLSATYRTAQPYPHCVLTDALDRSFLNSVVKEIKDHSKVDFKESDLFKFYQSMDLATLTVGDAVVPHVRRLRQLLYCVEWRNVVEKILGLPEHTLSDQVDCACNCHAESCHLLCHDDVIGTRRVSYILYLVDDDWCTEDGGALELYPPDSRAPAPGSSPAVPVPASIPSARIVPAYNSLGLFAVEPGVSFHAVQEVVRTRSPRLTLQGWYHASEPPGNAQLATLRQLKTRASHPGEGECGDNDDNDGNDFREFETSTVGDGSVCSEPPTLSEEERDLLSRYLDKSYLQPRALQEMRERFEQDSSLQLRGFLLPKWSGPLGTALAAADRELAVGIDHPEFYRLGVSEDWHLVGPPHKQRFLEYRGTPKLPAKEPHAPSPGLSELRVLMESPAFASFLACVTNLRPMARRSQIRRFRPGRDYTVAHYGLLGNVGILDATMVFCAGDGDPVGEGAPDDHPDVVWQSGECGGFECYIEVDETGEDEKYTRAQDDDAELLSVSAANNTLSLVYRDPGTMRFVKYLSVRAPSSRWDVCAEYRLHEVDSDDDVNGEKEDESNGDSNSSS